VCRAIGKVHREIKASGKPDLPLMWTEWNVPSFGDEYKARDTHYVGAALADDIRQCDGLVDILSYWTFDDVFEEGGVVREPFYGGFGTIAAGGIKKPSYYGYALLHMLGEERLANDANLLVTRRKDGALVVAVWNVVDPDKKGAEQSLALQFQNVPPNGRVVIHRVDATHGNVLPTYEAMGKPRYPTMKQIEELNQAAALGEPEKTFLKDGQLQIKVPVNGLAVMEVGR
jgi:xylan 1,4-beta-xylosidase